MVEENFGTMTLSPMSDLAPSPAAEGCGNEVTRMMMKDDHWKKKKDLSDREGNENQVHSTTWTNEKHNMYLNVLEASFVQQLHNSFSFVEKRLDLQHVNQNDSSDQLAVLQKGSWKKINLKKDQPLLCRTVGSHASKIESHWLDAHKFPHRCDWKTNPDLQENCIEITPSGRKRRRGFSHNLASSDSQSTFNHCQRKELDIEAEGTDQNFMEEVVEKPIMKKIKRDSMDSSTKITVSTETSTLCKASEDPAQP
ncbi:cold-regulated protein 27-like [Impatiens glandulifera]|uniref:cold-regulated protein 27-like n=1 Tax=Impatiens glandulifera TaxID=253017 RepID=UPI001FB0BEC0|nr:cold-regulated protein 27-like [Impatiens glandulifera]